MLLSAFIPSVSFALNLSAGNTSKFDDIITEAINITNLIIPILSSVAVIVFFWGLSKFILNSSKPDEIKNGKNYMMWGILALFILFTYSAIVSNITRDLGVTGTIDITNLLKTP